MHAKKLWLSLMLVMLLANLWLAAAPAVRANSLEISKREVLRLTQQSSPPTGPARVELNSTLRDLTGQVSGDRLLQQVENLSRFSRCATDPGHNQAAEYLKGQIKNLGFEPIVQSFDAPGVRGAPRLQNIVVRKPGANPRATHLIVAHWDSSPVRQFPPVCNSLAPGANDNASGSAALLEITRLLASSPVFFQDDIELVWFDGEEFGYLGSQHWVEQWAADRAVNPHNLPLGTVINLDMISYSAGRAGGKIWLVAQGDASTGLARDGAGLVASYLPQVNYGLYTIGDRYPAYRDPNSNSDHLSFWKAGLGTAIALNEEVGDIDPRWHTPGDTVLDQANVLRLNPGQMADATRVALLITASKARLAPARLFGNIEPLFEQTWSRADRPVRRSDEDGLKPGRGWLWGPQPLQVRTEPYLDAPGGTRQVVYWDKARMELTDPASGLVTNGLLVTEMASGRWQKGDNSFEFIGPSGVQVAGDNNQNGANANAPTYASFQALIEAAPVPNATGQAVSATLTRSGRTGTNPALAGYSRYQAYIGDTGHNIPDVFWNWFASSGPVYNPNTGQYATGPVFDWLSTVGLPISEAYWVRTMVGGVEKEVLVQLFQRRILTFTPSNPVEWRVEMGNAGQHYLAWRNR